MGCPQARQRIVVIDDTGGNKVLEFDNDLELSLFFSEKILLRKGVQSKFA